MPSEDSEVKNDNRLCKDQRVNLLMWNGIWRGLAMGIHLTDWEREAKLHWI